MSQQSTSQASTQASGQSTIIGAETHLSGTLNFEGSARILGKIDGKVIGSGEVHIGQQSLCRATIEAKSVTIDGTVEGNITAKERVQLNAGARVTGDIVADSLTIAQGATLQGSVRIGAVTPAGVIEGKTVATHSSSELSLEEPAATTSAWTPSKSSGLGSGLSGLGSSRGSWPSQR